MYRIRDDIASRRKRQTGGGDGANGSHEYSKRSARINTSIGEVRWDQIGVIVLLPFGQMVIDIIHY